MKIHSWYLHAPLRGIFGPNSLNAAPCAALSEFGPNLPQSGTHSYQKAIFKHALANAKEQIKYVQGGINTCKMDWFDLLSTEEKGKRKQDEDADGDFGTVDIVISDAEINQEDA